MSKIYTLESDESVFIDISDSWSRKSIRKATSGISSDMAEIINTKLFKYCLRRDDGTYIKPGDDFDVEDIDILILRWMFNKIVEHIDFLLK